MTILTIKELKKFIENLPEDYEIYYKTDTTTQSISSTIEVDLDKKQLIFK